MLAINTGKSDIHFQAIKLHNINVQKARPLIRHLSSSCSRTSGDVVELYQIFLPELNREASNKAKGFKMPDVAIRAFHTRFLGIIDHLGSNSTIESIIDMLNRFQPQKESSGIVGHLESATGSKMFDEKEFAETSNLLSNKIGLSNIFYFLVKKVNPESVPENIKLFNFEEFMKTDMYKKIKFESPFNEIIQRLFGVMHEISNKGIVETKIVHAENLMPEKLSKPKKLAGQKRECQTNTIPHEIEQNSIQELPPKQSKATNEKNKNLAKQKKEYKIEAQQHRKEQNLIWKLLKNQQKAAIEKTENLAKQKRKYEAKTKPNRRGQNLIWKLLEKQQQAAIKKRPTKAQLKALEKIEHKNSVKKQIADAKRVSPKEVQRLENTIQMFINKKQIPYTDSDVLVVRSIETIKALNVSFDEFIKLAKINPQLCYTKSKTIINKIGQYAKLFNCSFEEFKELILTDPNILPKKPETLLQNIQKGAEKLGCTFEEYKAAAFKLPALFYRSPDTILQNAQTSAKLLGTPEKEFIDCGLKHPILLMSKPDTLFKKLQIFNYYKKIKGEENSNRKIVITSYNRLYSNIMFYLLGKNTSGVVSGNISNFNIQKFIQANADKTFKFTIPQDPVANDFVQFINETSQKTIGKNIFELRIADNFNNI